MAEAKYVIIEERGLELPIVFSAVLTHKDRVKETDKVISAGFCSCSPFRGSLSDAIAWTVWGESISLGVKSRPEDADRIQRYLIY